MLVDEPTEGVQYENVLRMAELINARKAKGTAFVVVEQNLGFVEAIADNFTVLDRGSIVLEGRAKDRRGELSRHLVV